MLTRLVDPPSRAFGTDEQWIIFWGEMHDLLDSEPELEDWVRIAEEELRNRGIDPMALLNRAAKETS